MMGTALLDGYAEDALRETGHGMFKCDDIRLIMRAVILLEKKKQKNYDTLPLICKNMFVFFINLPQPLLAVAV